MQFGMPTLLETNSIAESAALCRELGLSFVELNMNFPQYQADRIDVAEYADIAKRYGIFFTIHFAENLNPCDYNKNVATAYIDAALQTIALAKRLSAPVLNMHLPDGIYVTLPDKKEYLFDKYADDYRRGLIEFRDKCASAIGDSDVKICVENANPAKRSRFWANGVDILTQSAVFAITFDIGHNAVADFSAEPYIMERIEKLRHFHIHDATNTRNHLTLGTGELDLDTYLRLARSNNCRCVLETKTADALEQSVEWLRERGYFS